MLPEGHEGDHIYTLWSEIAIHAEAAIQRVRELHRPCSDPHLHDGGRCCLECSDYGRQGVVRMYPCGTLNALNGDSDD